MKSKLFVLGAASLLFTACTEELQLPDSQILAGGTTPLSINVLANPTTKALVDGNTLPAGKIGVKLVDATGTTYDSQTYNNIFYNTTDGNTWSVDADHKILLSATEGKAYAYYPYDASESLDFTAIPISSAANPDEQIDYMFGNEATGLKNSNPTANFTMSHAMSIVNFTVAKGTYTGSGTITSVTMKGNTASNTGTMNAVAGSVTASNPGYEFTSTNSLTLGSAKGKFIVVPSGTQSALDFKVVMDGQTYTASTAAVELENGQVYKYTLTMNSTGLAVSQVTVTPWGEPQNIGTGSGDAELYKTIVTWDEAKAKDGVYGMMSDGRAMVYEAAATTSESLTGVAFVLNGKAYQVAKVDAIGTGMYDQVYWWKTGCLEDIDGLNNYFTADGTNENGYLPKADGSYFGSPHLDGDWTQWLTYPSATAALSDFNGQANTELILNAQSNGTVEDSIGKAIMDFRGNADVNEGHSDWFCPACGELAFMLLKKSDLETILNKILGTAFEEYFYWSSSEYVDEDCNIYSAWGVYFDDVPYVTYGTSRDSYFSVRLVRTI